MSLMKGSGQLNTPKNFKTLNDLNDYLRAKNVVITSVKETSSPFWNVYFQEVSGDLKIVCKGQGTSFLAALLDCKSRFDMKMLSGEKTNGSSG